MKSLFTAFLVSAYLLVTGCATPKLSHPGATAACTEPCVAASEEEIAALFDRWNQSLRSGDPRLVVANYADRSILLPTASNTPRLTAAEKEDYFHHFLEDQPIGEILLRHIDIGCNIAVDSGLYTFHFAKTGASIPARYSFTYRWDGNEWLIVSHHSSAMPEK